MLCSIISDKFQLLIIDFIKNDLKTTCTEYQSLTLLLRPAKVQLIIVTKAFKIVLFASPIGNYFYKHFQEDFFT